MARFDSSSTASASAAHRFDGECQSYVAALQRSDPAAVEHVDDDGGGVEVDDAGSNFDHPNFYFDLEGELKFWTLLVFQYGEGVAWPIGCRAIHNSSASYQRVNESRQFEPRVFEEHEIEMALC